MCQKESWGAIFATTEAHSTQRDQPQRMHGPGLWMYEQKEQRVTPVPMIPSTRSTLLTGVPSASFRSLKTAACFLLSGSLALEALLIRCALQEALYKFIDTIQYNTIQYNTMPTVSFKGQNY